MRIAAFAAVFLLLPAVAAAQQQRPQQRQAQSSQQSQTPELAQQVARNLASCIGQSREPAVIRSCMDGQRAALEPRMQAAVERFYALQPSPERRAAAEGVQAAWAAFRDARCGFAGGNPARGAEAPVDQAACLLEFVVSRTVDVEAVLQAAAPPAVPPPPASQQRR